MLVGSFPRQHVDHFVQPHARANVWLTRAKSLAWMSHPSQNLICLGASMCASLDELSALDCLRSVALACSGDQLFNPMALFSALILFESICIILWVGLLRFKT